jgi:SAM-dependent methyltransferase
MFRTITGTLSKNGAPPESMEAILDFGCGCGRVLRYWAAVRGPRVYGTDYNPRLITWCRENLPFARFGVNGQAPPLSYSDGVFDCVYAISIFTHISEEMGFLWMKELGRVLKPNGHIFFTTHGVSYRDSLRGEERTAFDRGEVVIQNEGASGMNLCGAFHPESYVRTRLAAGFTVCDFIPAGSRGGIHQDIYLFRKN